MYRAQSRFDVAWMLSLSIRDGGTGDALLETMLRHNQRFVSWLLLLVTSGCGAGDLPPTETTDSAMTGEEATSGEETGSSTEAGSACTPSGVAEADATRTVEAASVTVAATLLNALEHCAKDKLAIRLVLDTHSVDLLAYDIAAKASVVTSNGTPVEDGFAWEGGSESSHHRDGTLLVAAPPLTAVAWLRLTLPGVAAVDRTFEWDAELLEHDLP